MSGLLELIQGKKTYIGGISAILIGLGKLGLDWFNGKIAADPWEAYGYWLVLGWTIIAGRNAIKKAE